MPSDPSGCPEEASSWPRSPSIQGVFDAPKLRPTMQCHVGLYFLSNSFLMYAAMSFSMLYFSRACSRHPHPSVHGATARLFSTHSGHEIRRGPADIRSRSTFVATTSYASYPCRSYQP